MSANKGPVYGDDERIIKSNPKKSKKQKKNVELTQPNGGAFLIKA